MSLIFEWDEKKADENLRKHGVSFDEGQGRLIVVSYIERGEKIRIISSRQATMKEQGKYENK